MPELNPQSVCAVAVTYFPEAAFYKHFEHTAAVLGGGIVVDNGSSPSNVQQLKTMRDVETILNPDNRGLAAALNQGLERATERSFKWGYLLDQDTVLDSDFLKAYEPVFLTTAAADQIAVIGNNYRDAQGSTRIHFAALQRDAGSFRDYWDVITAGSLVSLPLFSKLGPFREDFFIDLIDTEYCLRAKRQGYRVVITTQPAITQRIGQTTAVSTPWGAVHPSHHSAQRRYYMARNLVLLFRMYGRSEPLWFISRFWSLFKMAVKIVFFENEKSLKLNRMAAGLRDAL